MPRLNGFSRTILMIALFSFVLVMVSSQTATAFPRKVLLEDFTNTGCPPCATLVPILEQALEATADVVVPIGIHTSGPDGSDPWSLNDRGANNDQNIRGQYYGIRYVPTLEMNGTEYEGARSVAAITNAINNASEASSPLEIQVSATLADDQLDVHLVIEAEEDVPRSVLQVALLENYFYYPQGRNVQENHNNMLRFLPNANGTLFSAETGEIQEFDLQLDMEGVGFHELPMNNLSVIAWVQNSNHTVYQAARYMFPKIEVTDWSVSDFEGNDDGRPEPGETGALVLEMTNFSPDAGLENLIIEVTSDNEAIVMDNNRWEIDIINAGEEINNSNTPITFAVPEDFAPNRVTLNISVMDENQNPLIQLPASFTAGWPQLLIIDSSTDEHAADQVRTMFGENGPLPFADYYDRAVEGTVLGETIENYEAVLWFSFNAHVDVMGGWEEEQIMNYLDNGGTFIMSSQYFARTGSGTLMRDYLRVAPDEANVASNYIHGLGADEPYFGNSYLFAGGQLDNCAGNPDFKPSLVPLEEANMLLQWGDHGDNLGAAAVEHVTDTYKTLFLAFPLESIGGFIRTDEREEFMDALWHWYMQDGESSAPGEGNGVPVQFALNPSYPNPFNAATMIPFSLNESGNVNLSLFDLSGSLVSQLFQGSMTAGSHTISLNGGNLGLTTGLYIVRLNANGQTAQQRVLYLK